MKKKKMGRPSLGLNLERHFNCGPDTIATLKALKKQTGRKEADLIRAAIAEYKPIRP